MGEISPRSDILHHIPLDDSKGRTILKRQIVKKNIGYPILLVSIPVNLVTKILSEDGKRSVISGRKDITTQAIQLLVLRR